MYLYDLNMIAKSISGQKKTYVIIPDNAGYWVKAKQQNPLSIDWVFQTELNNDSLINKVLADFKKNKISLVIILQKYDAEYIANECVPVNQANPVVKYVIENYDLLYETQYHYVYH